MDIRMVTEEEKKIQIDKVRNVFSVIRKMLDQLEEDMPSKDLMTQASSVWVGSNLCKWYDDFIEQIKIVSAADRDRLEKQIEEIAHDPANNNGVPPTVQ